MTQLTADLVARAIIASAVHYGDDPERAFTVERGILRRSLKAAACGLHQAFGGDLKTFARVVGLDPKNVYKDRDERVKRATAAVAEAVRYALGPGWKAPESITPLRRDDHLVQAVEPFLPQLFAAHPEGATSAHIAELAGLYQTDAADAAKHLHNRKLARWQRSGQRNSKVLVPWVEVPAAVETRPEPEVQPGPRRGLPGVVSSVMQPHQQFRPKVAEPTGTLGGRICGVLKSGDASTQALATILDAKELLVSQSLLALEHDGVVVADAMPEEGRRFQRWRLKEDIAA